MPDQRGERRDDAVAALQAAGFAPEVVEVHSETVDRGRIAAQEPSSGEAARGSEVALQVSVGPKLITVEEVVGQSREQAEQALEALGLDVRVIAIPGPGRVRSSDPGAGERVRKGSRVTLYVF